MSKFFRRPLTLRRSLAITAGSSIGLYSIYSVLSSEESPSSSLHSVDAAALYYANRSRLELDSGPQTLNRQSSEWIPPSRDDMINMLKGRPASAVVAGEGEEEKSAYAMALSSLKSISARAGGVLGEVGLLEKTSRAKELKPEPAREEEFDLLIVGGGATGAGCAVDAAARGLKVALVERDDFSSGTSSKSTKLVHGGVRYLQKAVFELDYDQYKVRRLAFKSSRAPTLISSALSWYGKLSTREKSSCILPRIFLIHSPSCFRFTSTSPSRQLTRTENLY